MTLKKRRILVTGSNGTVGSYITSSFPQDTLFLTTRKDLDITNTTKVVKVFNKIKPDIVIHLAAKTNVDDCENNAAEAYEINTRGTINITQAAAQTGSQLLYVSTAAVYKGTKKFYIESDKPNPINIYGRTKLLGEEFIKKMNSNAIIIRSGWVIGGGKKEKKFLSYILHQIKEGQKEIKAVNDKFGVVTYAKELTDCMKFLLDNKMQGIYHFGSLGVCSRFTIAEHITKLLNASTTVIPVSSQLFADRFFAPRPKNEVIHNTKLPASLYHPWQESINTYIKKEFLYE